MICISLRVLAASAAIGLIFSFTAACGPDDAEQHERFAEAQQAFARQELDQSLALVNELLDLAPGHTNARVLRGRIANYQKDYSAAIRDFAQAADDDAANTDALLWLARAQSLIPDGEVSGGFAGGPNAARATREGLVVSNSGNPAAWFLLGTLYERQAEPQLDAAIAAYRYGLVAGQNVQDIHLRLAEIYLAAELPDRARPHLNAALALASLNADGNRHRERLARMQAQLRDVSQ